MTTINNKASGREDIETLLPWHAAGTLSRRDAQRVEEALKADPELARVYEHVREELAETILFNETLGAPSARAMEKLFAKIDAEGATVRKSRPAINVNAWLTGFVASLSPRTLAWSATAAALAIALQAGLLAGLFIKKEGGEARFETASFQQNVDQREGTFARVWFAPEATAGDITKFLESHKATLVDGPKADGSYRVRLVGLPKEDLARTLKQMQDGRIVKLVASE
jgi:anti-sigma factor RsiW